MRFASQKVKSIMCANEGLKPLKVKVQNVVASVVFNQTFDLNAIANAFPQNIKYRPGRFPGLVFKMKEPKTAMLIFGTGKMVCTGTKSEDEARRAVLTIVEKLRGGGIAVSKKPEIQITNMVASASLGDFIDLEQLYESERMTGRGVIFEPEQFPALIYRMLSPEVVFLIFSTGKIVCAGAKSKKDIYEAVKKLRKRLEEGGFIIHEEI